MSKTNVLQEAIADAKIIRETALINAKNALEEALTPKFKSMMSKKLNEEEELDEEFNFDNDSNISERTPQGSHNSSFDFNNDELDEELNSILAELEDDELNESDLEEAKDDEKDDTDKSDKKTPPKKTSKDEPKSKEPKSDDSDSSDEKLSSLSVSEFTDLIKDIVSQEMAGDDLESGDDLGMDDLGDGTEDLGSDMGDEFGGADDEFGGSEMTPTAGMQGPNDSMDDDIDINELMNELDGMTENESLKEAKKYKSINLNYKKKLNEAVKVINVLRTEINEINLLNSKLLYVNKIFKAKNLNESQKLRVISSFDKAVNVKEAKLIYESLKMALSNSNVSNKKQQIKENLGYASKPAGMSPKKPILEFNEQLSRMQILAGIK